MFFKNLKILLQDINKISIKEKKNRAFIISNTADKKFQKYLTPLRISPTCIYGGAVVYNDITTKKICKLARNNIDYLFVDTEKKAFIQKRKKGAVNIERTVRENFYLEKIFYFKANDLTVDAASNLMELLFAKDIRNVSNKKILIIGAGNIGFKLSLKLIERGVKVFIYSKNNFTVKKLVSAINLVKPKATMNNVKYLKNINKNLSDFDVIINASNSSKIILTNGETLFKKNVIFLEIGKNLFSKDILNKLIENNEVRIFRLDVSNAFNELIEQKINNRSQWNKKNFIRKKIKNFNFITIGLLGKKGDIIVDDPLRPKIIYGLIDNNGKVKGILKKDKENIFKEIKKIL